MSSKDSDNFFMSDSLEGIFDPSSLDASIDAQEISQHFKFYSLCKENLKISFLVPGSACSDLIERSWMQDSSFEICFFGKIFSISLDSFKIESIEGNSDSFLITARIVEYKGKDT